MTEEQAVKQLIEACKALKWSIVLTEVDEDSLSKGCICGTKAYVDYILSELDD